MKKISILILSVLLITGLFISCDNSSAIPSEELVTITFDDAHSRSLTAELEGFYKDKLYWAYTAAKTDGGLTSGATGLTPVWIHQGVKGLEGQIPGFSQGKWKFTLFGYTDENGTKLAYQGTNDNVTLTRDSATSNKVIVTVNPIKDEAIQGTLVIDSEHISFKSQKDGDTIPERLSQSYKVTSLDGLTEYPMDGTTRTLAPGAYNVTVNFVKDDIVYGSGTVVATIYSNLTTTVKGELVELLTHVEFDSDLNPDVITKTVSSEEISSGVSDPVKVEKFGTTTDSKISAEVPADAVNRYINSVANELEGATTSNTKVVFSLNVNTTEASSNGVTYDIGMSAVAIIKKDNNNIAQVTKQIEHLSEAVTVSIQLQTGLTDVKVTHRNTEMQPLNSATDTSSNGYFYDSESGKLTIRTDSFSPFKVDYTLPEYYAASVNDVKYTTLSAAVNAAKNGDTVKLVNDVVADSQIIVKEKTITLDLNGYSITVGNTVNLGGGIIYIGNDGYLTINDTSTNETGKIDVTTDRKWVNNEGVVTDYPAVWADIAIYPENGQKAGLTINGGTFIAPFYPISGNGTDKAEDSTTITINDGTFRSTDGLCIYHPQNGTLTINGGTFEGQESAIEIRSGNLNITSGYFKASNTPTSTNPNGSGTTTDGSAIAVAQHTTKLPINVNISGGTFEGYSAFYESNPQNNSADDIAKVKLAITGGTFNAINGGTCAAYSQDKVGFITGGTFSSNPNAYVAKVYEAKEDGGKYVLSLKSGAKTKPNTGFPDGAVVINGQDTLNTSLSSAEENVTIYIGAGTFIIDNVDCDGKTIVFVGSGYDKTKLKYGTQPGSNGGESGSCYSFEGANVTFKDVTLEDVNGDDVDYKGFVRSNGLTFENCVLKSRMTYLGENGVLFKNCTFNTPKYAAWIYSSQTYNFVNCLFESQTGRFLNIYSENNINPVINATECMFKDTSDGTDSNAVFNIKSSAKTTLTIKDCLVTGASPMYKVEKDNGTTVKVDGITVYGTAN